MGDYIFDISSTHNLSDELLYNETTSTNTIAQCMMLNSGAYKFSFEDQQFHMDVFTVTLSGVLTFITVVFGIVANVYGLHILNHLTIGRVRWEAVWEKSFNYGFRHYEYTSAH